MDQKIELSSQRTTKQRVMVGLMTTAAVGIGAIGATMLLKRFCPKLWDKLRGSDKVEQNKS